MALTKQTAVSYQNNLLLLNTAETLLDTAAAESQILLAKFEEENR
jgi:hypothetical protein